MGLSELLELRALGPGDSDDRGPELLEQQFGDGESDASGE